MAKKKEVNLSNGEHYFTAQEVKELQSKGIDLSVLAPNANGGNGMRKGGLVGSNDTIDAEDFAIKVLEKLKIPVTEVNKKALISWKAHEGNGGTNNPLNDTTKTKTSTPLKGNSDGVQNYGSIDEGVDVIANHLKSSKYKPIVDALKTANDIKEVHAAIDSTPWGTHEWKDEELPDAYVKKDNKGERYRKENGKWIGVHTGKEIADKGLKGEWDAFEANGQKSLTTAKMVGEAADTKGTAQAPMQVQQSPNTAKGAGQGAASTVSSGRKAPFMTKNVLRQQQLKDYPSMDNISFNEKYGEGEYEKIHTQALGVNNKNVSSKDIKFNYPTQYNNPSETVNSQLNNNYLNNNKNILTDKFLIETAPTIAQKLPVNVKGKDDVIGKSTPPPSAEANSKDNSNGQGPNQTVKAGDATTKAPAKTGAKTTAPITNNSQNTFVDAFGNTQTKVVPKETMAQSKALNASIFKIDPLQTKIDTPTIDNNQIKSVPTTTTSADPGTANKKEQEKANAFDIDKLLAGIQLGTGLANKLGEVPIDKVDDTFTKLGDPLIEKLKQESMFGISPEERSLADRKIEMNRRADSKTIEANSGNDAGTIIGAMGASSLNADNAVSELAANSEKLRYAKLLGYKGAIDDKAKLLQTKNEMSRHIFEDKLNRFNQGEAVYGNLVGSGIKNLIEGDRYDKALQAQKERDAQASAPTYGGNTKWTKANIRSLSTDKTDAGYLAKAKEKGVDFNTLPEND